MKWEEANQAIIGDELLWADLPLNPPDIGPLFTTNRVVRSLAQVVTQHDSRPNLCESTISGSMNVYDTFVEGAVYAMLTELCAQGIVLDSIYSNTSIIRERIIDAFDFTTRRFMVELP